MYTPLLPMAISGVDAGDKSNEVAQSVSGNVLITYTYDRYHVLCNLQQQTALEDCELHSRRLIAESDIQAGQASAN